MEFNRNYNYTDIDRMINEGLAGGYLNERYGDTQLELLDNEKDR
ncbi:hypothetical protein [Virgibacillus sp. JSM 102003]